MKRVLEAVPADSQSGAVERLKPILRRLAETLGEIPPAVDRGFASRLERLFSDPRSRTALRAITLGAATRATIQGRTAEAFLEEVSYQGRRLAKLNVLPNVVAGLLSDYDRMLAAALPLVAPKLEAARHELRLTTLIALNAAYYAVREAETTAFYEMFWAELEARRLDDFLGAFAGILARFSKAQRAHVFLGGRGEPFRQRASYPASAGNPETVDGDRARLSEPHGFAPGKGPDRILLDPAWERSCRYCWSVPLLRNGVVAGVVQLGFDKTYEYLPREMDFLRAAAERCLMAVDKARMTEDLALREAEVSRLAEAIVDVEEAERRRISRELHDQTGQDLLWIRLQMELLQTELPDEERGWKSRLGDIREMTEKTISEIRRLIGALAPAVLEQLGLGAAVRQLANRFRQTHGWRVRVDLDSLPPLDRRTETVAYRIIQECFNNAAKHSGCTAINISLASADGWLRMQVKDNGSGFRVEDAFHKPGSFGLAGIRERVALAGGRCSIASRPAGVPSGARRPVARTKAGQGTTIEVELPVLPVPASRPIAREISPARELSPA